MVFICFLLCWLKFKLIFIIDLCERYFNQISKAFISYVHSLWRKLYLLHFMQNLYKTAQVYVTIKHLWSLTYFFANIPLDIKQSIQEWTKSNLWNTACKRFEAIFSVKTDYITLSFLKAVFHKCYLVHSQIVCRNMCRIILEGTEINPLVPGVH